MELMRNELLINEEKNIKNTFLYVRNVDINVESYEAKILAEENIENLLKYQIVYEGDKRVLKYDVSDTIGLDEFLKLKKLTKKDICKIITSIDDILMSIENYLLSENSIALDLKLVRVVRKSNGKIAFKFVAIPNYNSDFSYELSKLLIRILRFVDVEDREALSLAYGLFVRSSKDNYTINDLMELVDKVDFKTDEEDLNVEELTRYDEEMASEISEEIIEENRIDLLSEESEQNIKESNTIIASDKPGLIIDTTTKDILGDSILNDFDKDDSKIIRANRKFNAAKKSKLLRGNVSLGFISYILASIIVLLIPVLFYFVNA